MARRGTELREHILLAAKDAFLELGFERTSMDVVATRAQTSKRSLYAYFETKETLFLAVADLVRGLYLGRIKTPDHYAEDSEDAITLFCGRFLQMLMWRPILRTCRMGIAEVDRIPESSVSYYDAFFATTQDRLAAFLADRYRMDTSTSTDVAHQILGATVYPQLTRALFGLENLALENLALEPPDEASIATDVDLRPIRNAVARLLRSTTAQAGPSPMS